MGFDKLLCLLSEDSVVSIEESSVVFDVSSFVRHVKCVPRIVFGNTYENAVLVKIYNFVIVIAV